MKLPLGLILGVGLCWPLTSVAQSNDQTPEQPQVELNDELEDDWDDDWQSDSPLQVSHEVSYSYAGLINKADSNFENSVLNELRSKSKFDYQSTSYSVYFELELLADALIDSYQANAFQLSLLKSFDSGTDVRIGRQVITWGTGDLVFLNDLFSKDWKSFFNGRDDSYLKPPVDALRVSHYTNSVNFDLAWQPDFESDQVLTGERYSFYLPGAGVVQPRPELSINATRRSETALRIFGAANSIEWSLYGYRGFFKSPSTVNESGELGYSRMDSLGSSLLTPLWGGLFNAEFSQYLSREDSSGRNPLIANSQQRFLLGFESEIASDLTLGVQAYLEKTLNYNQLNNNALVGQVIPAENRTMATFRLTHQALQQRLLNSFMLFYSPSDQDYYLRYSSRYVVSDNWKWIAGINFLQGQSEQTFLSQLENNSNLFFRVQLSFE